MGTIIIIILILPMKKLKQLNNLFKSTQLKSAKQRFLYTLCSFTFFWNWLMT